MKLFKIGMLVIVIGGIVVAISDYLYYQHGVFHECTMALPLRIHHDSSIRDQFTSPLNYICLAGFDYSANHSFWLGITVILVGICIILFSMRKKHRRESAISK